MMLDLCMRGQTLGVCRNNDDGMYLTAFSHGHTMTHHGFDLLNHVVS